MVTVTIHAYNEGFVKVPLIPQAVDLARTDLGIWHDFYVVDDNNGKMPAGLLLGTPGAT